MDRKCFSRNLKFDKDRDGLCMFVCTYTEKHIEIIGLFVSRYLSKFVYGK
jgi:hypothetical protein